MGWRHVLFASWPIEPDRLAERLPAGLEPDTYEGRAYLSVVPFTNVGVRPNPLPSAVGVRLPELNLRTYVRLAADPSKGADVTAERVENTTADGVGATDATADGDEHATTTENETDDTTAIGVENATTDGDVTRPSIDEGGAAARSAGGRGVYFFSLDADGAASVLGARVTHHLPYYLASISLSETDNGVRFRSRRRHPGAQPLSFRATYRPTGEQFAADPSSLAAFLTDRDRYYTATADGTLRTATVEHEPWPLYRAEATLATEEIFRANGFAAPDGEPVLLYSPSVETTASPNRPV